MCIEVVSSTSSGSHYLEKTFVTSVGDPLYDVLQCGDVFMRFLSFFLVFNIEHLLSGKIIDSECKTM